MKVVVASKGENFEDEVNELFARCPFFVIADVEKKRIKKKEAFENISSKKSGGAGIAASGAVVEKGAEAVITGNIGPRAKDVLTQFGVKIFKGEGKVEEALKSFSEGKLGEL